MATKKPRRVRAILKPQPERKLTKATITLMPKSVEEEQNGSEAVIQDKTVLTVAQAAQYLQISTRTMYNLLRDGAMPAARIGSDWRIHRDAIDAFLQRGGTSQKKRGRPRRSSASN